MQDDYLHYLEPRILTVREYSRIQCVPDRFEFKGNYTTGSKERKILCLHYTQAGNAMPPLVSEILDPALKEYTVQALDVDCLANEEEF